MHKHMFVWTCTFLRNYSKNETLVTHIPLMHTQTHHLHPHTMHTCALSLMNNNRLAVTGCGVDIYDITGCLDTVPLNAHIAEFISNINKTP